MKLLAVVLLGCCPALAFAQSAGQQAQPDQTADPESQAPVQEPIPALPPEPLPPVPAGARVVASPQMTLHADGQASGQTQAVANASTAKAQPDRDKLIITAWDLDVLLRPATHGIAVRARMTVRNDDSAPRSVVTLDISSSLRWQSVTLDGKPVVFAQTNVDTGFDHTAAAREAVISLPQPLAAGASVVLDAFYEGDIPVNATRIELLGAPPDIAEHTDWDRISGDFTGLRGAGNVLWFPIAAEPVMLGDGAKLFAALGRWKMRHEASTMQVRLRVDTSADVDLEQHAELTKGKPQMVVRAEQQTALVNGVRLALTPDAASGGVLTAVLPASPLGFSGGSLFLAGAEQAGGAGVHVYSAAGESNAAQAYPTAVNLVRPLVEQWLPKQQRDLAIVSLPRDGDAASTTQAWWRTADGGPVLATAMPPQPPDQLTPALANLLARGSFLSPRPWLQEGVAELISALWAGRDDPSHALGLLEDGRSALSLAEPADATSGQQPLIAAYDDVFYRIKAAYVLWMLRDICGDEAVIAALKAYRASEDKTPEYFERLVEAASHKDLAWFFADWVYADRGLPDLRIANVLVHNEDAARGSWLMTIDVANDGYAAADVPVMVDTGGRQETQRLRVPGRGTATARIVVAAKPVRVTVGNGSVPEVGAVVHVREL